MSAASSSTGPTMAVHFGATRRAVASAVLMAGQSFGVQT
jgi:hypothetical protein